MRRKKEMRDMSVDELIALVEHEKELRDRRNARRRARRQWLKTAPREETALKYRAEEKPCSVALYLRVERALLRRFPELKAGDATEVLLALAHNILHLLHPEADDGSAETTLADCTFSTHELCTAALEIAMNYRLDPAFQLDHAKIFEAMMALTGGIDRERSRFNSLLGNISIDL